MRFQGAKLHANLSNRSGVMAVFLILQDGGRPPIWFLKVGNFNCRSDSKGNMRHHAKFCAHRSHRGSVIAFLIFQDGGHQPSGLFKSLKF